MRINTMKSLGLAAAIISLAVDQIVKSWAVASVAVYGDMQLGQWLNVVSVQNSGVAFGIATGSRPWILIALGLALTLGLSVWLLRSKTKFQSIGLGLAIGGALGNIADRFFLASVRDFLDFHWGNLHWPAFNLADVFILLGLTILVLVNEEGHVEPAEKRPTDEGSDKTPFRVG